MPSSIAYNLLEACRQPGCPICRLEEQGVERYLDNQFYESVNSPAWRDRLRSSQGLCHEHAWLAVNRRLGDPLGFSIIYHDVVTALLREMDRVNKPSGAAQRASSLLRQVPVSLKRSVEKLQAVLLPRKRCPACEHREEVRGNLFAGLIDDLETPGVREALDASDGLCLPHLRGLLGSVREPAQYEVLLSLQRRQLENLRSELAEFIRKNDYQAVREGFGNEGDAWLRAVAMIAGARRGSS